MVVSNVFIHSDFYSLFCVLTTVSCIVVFYSVFSILGILGTLGTLDISSHKEVLMAKHKKAERKKEIDRRRKRKKERLKEKAKEQAQQRGGRSPA